MGQHTSREKESKKVAKSQANGIETGVGIGTNTNINTNTSNNNNDSRDSSINSLNSSNINPSSSSPFPTPSISSTPIIEKKKKEKKEKIKKIKPATKPTLKQLEEQSKQKEKERELQEQLAAAAEATAIAAAIGASNTNTNPNSRRESLQPSQQSTSNEASRRKSATQIQAPQLYNTATRSTDNSPSFRPQPYPHPHLIPMPLINNIIPSASNQHSHPSTATVAPHPYTLASTGTALEKTVVATNPINGAYPIVRPPADESSPFEAPLDHIREEERPFHHLSTITYFDVPTLRKLHLIFNEISESQVHDGIIDVNELTDAMGLKNTCLLARAIFKIFDITATKKINFRTWVTTLSALSVKANIEEKIRFSFSLYDLNGDGCIDVNELRNLLAAAVRENVLHLNEEQVRSICDYTLADVDKDGNGTVDYNEYRAMVEKSHKFLESFTLDINQLCGSFRFNSRTKSGADARISEQEADKKANLFRQRQKNYSNQSDENIENQQLTQQQQQQQQQQGGGERGGLNRPISIKSPPEILRQLSTDSSNGEQRDRDEIAGIGIGVYGTGGGIQGMGNNQGGEDQVRSVRKMSDLHAELNLDIDS